MSNKTGSALIFVLWIISILSVLAFEISFQSKVNSKLIHIETNKIKYYPAILTCLKTGLKVVLNQNASELSYLTNSHFIFSLTKPQYSCELYFTDEAGKYDINKITEKQLLTILENLNFYGEQRDIIVDSILDWKDKDNFRRLNGAENEYYLSLKIPYKCKNNNFDLISELLLIKGINRNIYNTFSKIFSTFSNTTVININSAPKEVLKSLGLNDREIDILIKERNKKIFLNMEDLLTRTNNININKIQDKIRFKDSGIYNLKVNVTFNNHSSSDKFLIKLNPQQAQIISPILN